MDNYISRFAEIERYKQGAAIAKFDNAGENAEYFQGKVELCDDLTHIIASLQQEQPEVDLEKNIDAFFDKWDKNSNGAIFDENGTRVTIETIKGVVKHFLNARKEG